MSLDAAALARAVAAHGAVMRVVVAAVAGSAPREAGAAMLVWAGGQDGTIGGGALEYRAAATARAMLAEGRRARLDRIALGPALAQCCGGAVTLLTELWDQAAVAALAGPVLARPLPGEPAEPPLAVRRILAAARGEGRVPDTTLVRGWLVEPLAPPARQIWIWGAGHVGRALVAVLAPLPGMAITWIDTARDRFPDHPPPGVALRVAPRPGDLADEAPPRAEHLVLTYSHALDLDLCDRLLRRGVGALGLIGSASKAARFRSRLAALGHDAAAIARIDCPIGLPALGKHPQAIAVGVAATLLMDRGRRDAGEPRQDAANGGQAG